MGMINDIFGRTYKCHILINDIIFLVEPIKTKQMCDEFDGAHCQASKVPYKL